MTSPVDAPWLVTGGAGWLGTNLLNHLVAEGRTVRALVLPSEALAVRARFGAAVDVVEGDVRDQTATAALNKAKAETVLAMLAGQAISQQMALQMLVDDGVVPP